jgi:hypothetical protein
VPILLFFIFIAVVVVCILVLYYSLSSVEKRRSTWRCRMPHEMHRRRKLRRQRMRCRFEV